MVHGGQRDGHRRGPAVSGGLSDRIQAHRIDHSSGLVGLAGRDRTAGGRRVRRDIRRPSRSQDTDHRERDSGRHLLGVSRCAAHGRQAGLPRAACHRGVRVCGQRVSRPRLGCDAQIHVDIRSYPKARSLNEGRDATINMAGSPVGGLLYGIAPWLPFLSAAVMYLLAGVAATRIRVGGNPRNGSDSGNGDSDDDGGKAGGASFFRDFAEGWSWSLHRRMLVLTMVSSALANFGVNGFQYAIQLHLMRTGVNATLIGFVNTGVFLAMLAGAFIAGRISDTAPVGPVTCCGFVFICIASLPMLLTDNYWVLLIANAVMCLPFPIINALQLGFIFGKTPDTMQGRITVTLTVPAQALSAFCSATAGSLLPAFGFSGTMLVFWAVMLVSMLLIVSSRSLRTIPRADQWDRTPLE